jgi:hypothetical protein
MAVYLPIEATATTIAPTVLLNSALVVPAPIDMVGATIAPAISGTIAGAGWRIIKDLGGRDRISSSLRADPIRDALEREPIVDIYLGRP